MKEWMCIGLALVACNAQVAGEGTGAGSGATASASLPACDGGVQFTNVKATVLSLIPPVGLCELAKFYTAGAGFYRVAQMTGCVEQIPPQRDPYERLAGFTYVDLELLEAWTTNAPPNPRVLIEGGPVPNMRGVSGGFSIQLAVDETVGVLIEEALPSNLDQLGVHELTVFHRVEGNRFSNGQLTFERGELARHVHDVFEAPASVDCDALKPPEPKFEEVPPPGTDIPGPPGEIILGTSESGPGEALP